MNRATNRPIKRLSEEDRYRSRPPRHRSGAGGASLRTAGFYAQVFATVCRSAWQARGGRYGDGDWSDSSQRVLRICEWAGMDIEITGLDHLASVVGPVVVVGNHMSTLETFLLPGVVRPYFPVTFVVKKSLVTYPVFGPVMRSRNPVVVGRENPREDLSIVLKEGAARLGDGISIILFPQSTRSSRFDPAVFNTLGVKLAGRAGARVIPVAIRSDAWGNGRILRDFGAVDSSRPVRIAFGESMAVEGRGEEQQRRLVEFIGSKLNCWGIDTGTSSAG